MSLSANFPTSKPTLNLDFANVGALDPRITFSRTSSATYTNSLGLIATAAAGVARFDYDPVTLAARGLLIEEQRTNVLTYSEQFDNAAWTKTLATVTANTDIAPDGTVTADTITFTGAFGDVSDLTSVNPASTAYTGSVWLKGSGTLIIRISNNVDQQFTTTVTLTSTLTRYTVTGTFNATAGQVFLAISRNNLTATSVVAWGAQLEAGSFATSYIPTVASTVTRNADVASVNTLSPWFNATEGTLFAQLRTPASTGFPQVVFLSDGTVNNYVQIDAQSGLRSNVVVSANDQASFSGANNGGSNKVAIGYKANDFGSSFNGGATATDVSGSVPTVSVLGLGQSFSGSNILNGWLERVAYYPRKLSSAEIQALTA